jgi:uncharacterized protein GlcG (DUF336 family)
MPKNLSIGAIALAASLLAGAVQAQAVRTEKNISLDLANQLASATVAACTAGGFNVAVTVVDRAGVVRAVQRADSAGPHTLGSSQQKAWTAASAKTTSMALMEAAQKNPGSANLTDLPGFLLLGGGVPVKVGNETIGGVGVGGAPTGAADEQCAMAGLDKIRDQLK